MRTLTALMLCFLVLGLGTVLHAEAKSGKSAKSHKSGKSQKSGKSHKSEKSGKSTKSKKSGKSEKPGGPVEPPNLPPTASDARGRFPASGSTFIPAPGVLAGASDPDGDTLTVIDFDTLSALGAEVSISPDGAFAYRPLGSAILQALQPGETAVDTFTYTISDGRGGTATGTVTITVFR